MHFCEIKQIHLITFLSEWNTINFHFVSLAVERRFRFHKARNVAHSSEMQFIGS